MIRNTELQKRNKEFTNKKEQFVDMILESIKKNKNVLSVVKYDTRWSRDASTFCLGENDSIYTLFALTKEKVNNTSDCYYQIGNEIIPKDKVKFDYELASATDEYVDYYDNAYIILDGKIIKINTEYYLASVKIGKIEILFKRFGSNTEKFKSFNINTTKDFITAFKEIEEYRRNNDYSASLSRVYIKTPYSNDYGNLGLIDFQSDFNRNVTFLE